MSWLFFMDESGHDGKNTPHVVVGGFGIDENDYQAFESIIKEQFTECFGINLSDFVELKGASLLGVKKFKWAKSRQKMSDEDRRMHVQRFLSKDRLNSLPNGDDHAAYGQACLMFVERVFDVMTRYNCKVIASITSIPEYKKIYEPRHLNIKVMENFTTHMLNDLETVLYSNLLNFAQNNGEITLTSDRHESKSDNLKLNYFYNYLKLHENSHSGEGFKNSYHYNLNIKIEDSKDILGIQIADIICYTLNYGFYFEPTKQNTQNMNLEIHKIAHTYIHNERFYLTYVKRYPYHLINFINEFHLKTIKNLAL